MPRCANQGRSLVPSASVNNTYVVLLARTVDILLCGWVFRQYDITISSMCGLELRKPAPARWARILGGALNWLQTGHCESAIAADIARCKAALGVLGG